VRPFAALDEKEMIVKKAPLNFTVFAVNWFDCRLCCGAGCTNGGIQTFLKNSRAGVKIPDCIRLRADGTNEVAGITPDVLIPWRRNESRYQRVKRVFYALSEYIK
jgi:hypothetical protein